MRRSHPPSFRLPPSCFGRLIMKRILVFAIVSCVLLAAAICLLSSDRLTAVAVAAQPIDYATRVEPVMKKFCFECHGNGADEGELALDQLTKTLRPADDHFKWLAVWKNLRAQTMP